MKSLVIALFIFCFLFLSSSLIWASGLTTTTSNQGQVQVRNEDGIMYLTTQTNQETQQQVGTTSQDATQPARIRANILLPQGYSPDISTFINGVLVIVMIVAALFVFLYLLLGAFKWITSGGDKGKIEQARNHITSAVIGLIILAASYAILNLALSFLGFSGLNDVFSRMGTIYGPAPSPTPVPVYETDLQEVIESTPSGTNN